MATATNISKATDKTVKTISPKPEIVPGISKEIIHKLSNEINNMLSYAIFNGITINTEVNTLIQNSTVDDLINSHNILCKNISPATPKSIEYTKKLREEEKGKTLFSKLPLVRNLIILSIIFLIAFIITGLSPEVNNDSLDKGIMDNQGLSLLLNLGFLTAISGLGVLFYLLKNVSTAVKNGTLVPEDTIYYVALIILGVIAGLISSEIISFYQKDAQQINLFNKGLMALIGGFSSDAIFSILQGIIDRIKAIFIPSNSTT
ncbi:hypothetical protein D1815_18430 [Aquimarina sp. AD1]|uniref:hypothetical protein n=1 Tax=Aquimarina sp. (strain AD1) TaxID=1714848 RepID=UPI000E4CE528|nr:hypothetical protein [Aquimarina sp. AD1]AXT57631.1 hypothetical protein D1815_18430 [Aquimarina sp. AD1]RKN28290.1 hypothetical protein D7035_08320 [Aquimarina sp. AD1]